MTISQLTRVLDTATADTKPPHIFGHPGCTIETLYAAAGKTTAAPERHALYHCPTCPAEELRLTWDSIRKRHAGFCKVCLKLWPLPRNTITTERLKDMIREAALNFGE
jgi:hypothetical protein